jgi:uncharacterized lipoprotein YajG
VKKATGESPASINEPAVAAFMFMKIMKLIVPLVAVTALLAACSRQHSDSRAVRASDSSASGTTNQPGKSFTTKDGSTVRIGALTVDGTNVPLTNIQVR